MPTQVTASFTDGTSSDAVQSLFNTMLLTRGIYNHHAHMLVKKNMLKQRQGTTMIWRRYEALPLATTPVTEGVTGNSRAKTKTDVSATLNLYGDFIENSDVLTLTQPEGVLADVGLLAQQTGETMDALYMALWATATNTTFANGTGTAQVNTTMVYNDWVSCVRALNNRKAKRFQPQIEASQKVGTLPVQPSHWAIVTESQIFDLQTEASVGNKLILAAEYGSGSAIMGEYGALKCGIRLLPVPDSAGTVATGATGGTGVQQTGANADVHSAYVIGKEAGLGVNLAVGNGGVIRKAMGSGGTTDPLNQRATIGWKKFDTRAMGNQDFLQEFQCAVSA